MAQQFTLGTAYMVNLFAEAAIFLGQHLIRIAFKWQIWAEEQGHVTEPRNPTQSESHPEDASAN